jgi:hypothetical protein
MKEIFGIRDTLFGDQELDDFLDLAVDRLKKLRSTFSPFSSLFILFMLIDLFISLYTINFSVQGMEMRFEERRNLATKVALSFLINEEE